MLLSPFSYIYIIKKGDLVTVEGLLSYKTWLENSTYFAECTELQLIDHGEFLRVSLENLRKMIILTLTEAIQADKIDDMLIALGFNRAVEHIPNLKVFNAQFENTANLHPLMIEDTRPLAYSTAEV